MSKRAQGFTLLEVLVAVAVFAVMSSLAYAGLTRMLEGRDRIEAERERWRLVALAMAQLEDDLSQARARAVRDVGGGALPAFRGQPVDPRPLGDPSIELTRGGLYLAPESTAPDIQRVAYRLREGTLYRLSWSTLDRPPVSEPREIPLLPDVDNMAVRFHAPNGSWSERWPATEDKNALPDAVEFAFDMAGVGRLTRVLLVGQ